MSQNQTIIDEFILFLKNNNVMATLIATVLSTYVTELTTSFADDIILPIIYRDGDGDGKADIKSLKKLKFNFYGITFKVGNFVTIFLKVTVVFIVLFLVKKNLSTTLEK